MSPTQVPTKNFVPPLWGWYTASMDAKPHRRWFRFSLRTLLVLATIASAGFGWLGLKMRQAQRQRAAVEAIRKSKGAIFYEHQVDSEGDIINSQVRPGPNWLRRVVGDDFFDSVIVVRFGPAATDADFRDLVAFDRLKGLVVDFDQTDAGLADLPKLNRLKWLNLDHTRTTDAGLIHLARLNRLEWLNLEDTRTTDAGLIHLARLNQLKTLQLKGTRVTDAGCEKLHKALPNLKIER
jgi:hypothetical protein